MSLQIIQKYITQMNVDAIVNTNMECETNGAVITREHNLPCKYVIHMAATDMECELKAYYKNSLELAKRYSCDTIAIPLVPTGIIGNTKGKTLRIAVDTVSDFLQDNEMTVYISVSDKTRYGISDDVYRDIEKYIEKKIDENLCSESIYDEIISKCFKSAAGSVSSPDDYDFDCDYEEDDLEERSCCKYNLESILKNIDEGFSETLIKLIDKSGKKDSEIYKKANIDRKLFSKIRNSPNYKPSKPTVLAFAIALELNLSDTKDLLSRAGFTLSHSSKFDIIVEYFILEGNYNIFHINEALFAFDQNLLGS